MLFASDKHLFAFFDKTFITSFLYFVQVKPRRPEAALEKIIPADCLHLYKEHFEQGCALICGDSECHFKDDKVYHEWKALSLTEPEISPKETRKRGKVNKKESRKKLKLAGKESQTSKGKTVPARKKMEWVEC